MGWFHMSNQARDDYDLSRLIFGVVRAVRNLIRL